MKTRNSIIIALIVCAVMISCEKGDVRETPSGFKFSVIKKGDGRVAKPGEVVIMDMIIQDEHDSLWHNSKLDPFPEMVMIREESLIPTEHGLVETFRMISKGDSIVLKMKASDFFPLVWKATIPSYMDPETIFTTQVLCRDILDSAGYRNFIAQIQPGAAQSFQNEQPQDQQAPTSSDDQLKTDMMIIDAFLRSKNMTAQNHPSGLRYIIKKEGTGSLIKDGDYATMRYAGQNLGGAEFDSGEYSFIVGNREVIEGWDVIAKSMKEGTSLTVFIPSTMGYGPYGSPPVIMPNAILTFDMECISVKRR